MRFNFTLLLFSCFFIVLFTSIQNNGSLKNSDEVIYSNFTSESHLKWRASHLGGIAPRFGRIFLKKAHGKIINNQLNELDVEIDMNSIVVENFRAKNKENAISLEEHLKSPDFFNSSLYPISKFQMNKIESGNEEYNSFITGDLTILDITRSISFYCNIKKTKKGLSIHSQTFEIDRTLWGVSYHKEGLKGISKDAVISNKIIFEILIHLKS